MSLRQFLALSSILAVAVGPLHLFATPPPKTVEGWLKELPASPEWETWLRAQPSLPDLAALPGQAWLPDPLLRIDGTPVRRPAEWPARREELLRLFQHYVTGTMPPAPGNVRVESRETRREGSVTQEKLVLAFGPDHRARLRVELLIPDAPGPRPVFLTQENHRAWAVIAVSRGYLGCIYAGADSQDDAVAFSAVWPDHDWSLLARRAWAGSRCIDYLVTRPEVDRTRLALTGHSRNAKQSLIAAAFDDRIAAVISSSAGAGGSIPYRLSSETQLQESIEILTRRHADWIHPRLRFFVGRENRLPIDQHELVACIAPRACLLSIALNDSVENVWGLEHTWREARRVYELFGQGDALALRHRPFSHATRVQDIEAYLDWLDLRFGRGRIDPTTPPLYPTYADWQRASRELIDPARLPLAASADVRTRVAWLLGEAPPLAPTRPDPYGSEPEHWAQMLYRGPLPKEVEKVSLNFGHYLAGDLYRPAVVPGASAVKLPAVIWLHPHSVPFGYIPAYGAIDRRLYQDWVKAGFAAFCFDQVGTGSRIEEFRHFYDRHPHWSMLGRTVADTRAAVDALLAQPFIDPQRIYLVGFATGSMAALHAAALDPRIAGVVAVAGITPLRTDTLDKGTGGVARWAQWLPLVPRLGAFVGHEAQIPYDYDDLLGLIAPRPVVLLQPSVDYQSTAADLASCFARAEKSYQQQGRPGALQVITVDDYLHYSRKIADEVVSQLKRLATP
ncbi:MAG: prolyl oligopeptidase family serine peptidase [Opitutaceae bacterium]